MSETIEIEKSEFYKLYSIINDATIAVSHGDPYECAAKVDEAEDKIKQIRNRINNE